MSHEEVLLQRRFFQFSLPSLPDLTFVLPGQQVVAVSDMLPVVQIPLLPLPVEGICQWAGLSVTVFNLPILLDPAYDADLPDTAKSLLIARNDIEYFAWAILPGASFIDLPAQIPAETTTKLKSSPIIFAIGQHDNRTVSLLDLNRIHESLVA